MFRVLVTTACILFVILVAIIIANSVSSDTPISTPNKLQGNLTRNSKGNETAISQGFKLEDISNKTTETTDVSTETNATVNIDPLSVASEINKKEVKVASTDYGLDGEKSNISAVIHTKKELINSLREEIKKAETDLQKKTSRLKELEQRVSATRNLSLETQKQFDMLISTMNVLQNSILTTSKAANEAFWQAQLQTAKFNDAKRKHSKLVAELGASKSDYGKMKVAVDDAMKAAKIAMGNIQDSTYII